MLLYNCAFYFWCCRCTCQLCGGSKPNPEGYEPSEVNLHKFVYVGFFVFLIIFTVLSIVFLTMQFATILNLQGGVYTLIGSTENNFNNLLNIAANSNQTIDSIFYKINDVYNALDGIRSSFSLIDSGLDGVLTDIYNISYSMDALNNDLQNLSSILNAIASGLSSANVSSGSSVPSIASNNATFTSAVNAIDQSKSQIASANNTLNNIEATIKTDVSNTENNIKNALGNLDGRLSGPVQTFENYLQKFNFYYAKAKRITNGIDGSVYGVFLAFYILVPFIFALGLIAVFKNSKFCSGVIAFIAFITPFLFLLMATLQLIPFVGISDFCREAGPTLQRSEYLINSAFGSSGNSSYLNATAVVNTVLHCGPNGSFLDLVPSMNLSLLNVEQYVIPFKNALDSEIAQFNNTNIINSSETYLNQFVNLISHVDIENITSPLQQIGSQLDILYQNLANYNQSHNQTLIDLFVQANQTISNSENEINNIQTCIQNTISSAAIIRNGINLIPVVFNNVTNAVYDVIDYALNDIATISNSVLSLASCYPLSTFIQSSKTETCNQLAPYSGVISIIAYLTSMLLLSWFISILLLRKRICSAENNVVHSFENDYELPEKGNVLQFENNNNHM